MQQNFLRTRRMTDASAVELTRSSPHSLQVLLNPGFEARNDIAFTRVLHDDAPQKEYRKKEFNSTLIHWGQRKLLMSEIEFLTMFARQAKLVVYAGAAPGTHIGFLSQMFPSLKFLLVDPAPFTVRESDNIKIIQDLFTDELAMQLQAEYPEGLLFVSDVRSTDYERDADNEEKIQEDMGRQQRWHMLLRPLRSMLKFRLPWSDGMTEYLEGDIFLPVWGPVSTTETRLITSENSVRTKPYDNRKYEQQMFYFNTVTRPAVYENHIGPAEGLDHCYDCTAEKMLLSRYLVTFRGVSREIVCREVALLSRLISRQISLNRTLLTPNPDGQQRRNNIRRNQWVNGRPAYEPR